MSPFVSQMIAEDRMAARHAEAAAYRRAAGETSGRRRPWRHAAAVSLTRLAAVLEPSLSHEPALRRAPAVRAAGSRH